MINCLDNYQIESLKYDIKTHNDITYDIQYNMTNNLVETHVNCCFEVLLQSHANVFFQEPILKALLNNYITEHVYIGHYMNTIL